MGRGRRLDCAPRAGPTRVNRRPRRLGASLASQARSYITVPGSFPPRRSGPCGPCPLVRPPAAGIRGAEGNQEPQGREASALSPEAPGTSWKSGSARGWGLRLSFPIRNQGSELGRCVSQLGVGAEGCALNPGRVAAPGVGRDSGRGFHFGGVVGARWAM